MKSKTEKSEKELKKIFIQFGGTGDLARKKLIPAYYELFKKGNAFSVISLGRRYESREEYIKDVVKIDDQSFLKRVDYVQYDMYEPLANKAVAEKIEEISGGDCGIELIYYIALQPELYEKAIHNIKEINSHQKCNLSKKIIVEKPFGFDLASAKKYNKILESEFTDEEIYRVDHYLGKEFMQNLLVMRFYNDIIQSIWNKNYIDYIQIMFDETHGVDQRLGFYEKIGVVRDSVQNHILQIITYLTMGEPVEFTPENISSEKLKVLKSIRQVNDFHLGKYSSLGKSAGKEINTPTYAALKFYVDTFEFSGVPIYVRTGKKQKKAKSMIYVKFKNFKNRTERAGLVSDNAMIITIHPEMNIDIALNMKKPHSSWGSHPVKLNFNHSDTFKVNTPEAYEQILEKIILGDKSLFPSMSEINESWKIVEPMLASEKIEVYDDKELPQFASNLLKKDNIEWFD